MGKVMAVLKAKLAGRADMSAVSRLVKERMGTAGTAGTAGPAKR
jgi:hypothetical protein